MEVLMTVTMGRVVAALAEPVERIPSELIDLINRQISPPENVGANDVYVRAMYVVSDEVNSFGGRFPADEHERLAALLIDSPVMVGHRKDKLPIGRTFHATTVERNGRPWVKGYFYWLRSAADAETLRDNIDGGVYKECSVAFTFLYPECSLCGEDIRRCNHQPLQDYTVNGVSRRCHFNYRRLEKVLETSLVYRGAVPDTRITKELHLEPDGLSRLGDPADLPPGCRYLVVPRYDGVPVVAHTDGESLVVERTDGTPLPIDSCLVTWRPSERTSGILVGFHGRDRCPRQALERYISRGTGPVTRLLLNVFPDGSAGLPPDPRRSAFDVRVIPSRVASRDEIDRSSREIMTRLGVEIRPLAGDSLKPSNETGYHYEPGTRQARSNSCRLEIGDRSYLVLQSDDQTRTFEIVNLDTTRLAMGRRFVARPLIESSPPPRSTRYAALSARLEELSTAKGPILFRTTGSLEGSFRLQPARLHGDSCFMFHRLSSRNDGKAMVIPEGAAFTKTEKTRSVLQPDAECHNDGE